MTSTRACGSCCSYVEIPDSMLIDELFTPRPPITHRSALTVACGAATMPYLHRYELAALAFFGFFNVYAMRVNLSVAAVKMADEYCWSKPQEGVVLGSFFYGYIYTQVMGGWLSTRFGGKWVFGLGVLGTAVLTIITPWVAHSLPLLIVVRVLEGVGEGVTFPAMHGVWARWAPPEERTFLTTVSYTGAQMGTIISMPISGYICGSHWRWPAVFYLCGGLGVVWFVLWIALMHSDPRTHPRISEEERHYIVTSIERERVGDTTTAGSKSEQQPLLPQKQQPPLLASQKGQPDPTPWRAIFTSAPMWAIVFGHVSNNWGFYNLLVCLPSYLHNVLGLDIAHAVSGIERACACARARKA
jgi:MFS family permease